MNEASIYKRLEKLERENRRLKQIGVVILLICSMAFLMGQAKAPASTPNGRIPVMKAGTLEVGLIKLLAPDGKVRAEFGVHDGGAVLNMMDTQGDTRVSLTSNSEPIPLSGLQVLGPKGDDGVRPEASITPGLFRLLDHGAFIRMIAFRSSALGDLASINIAADEPTLRVGRMNSYYTEIGSSQVQTVATGESHKTSAASAVMFDDKGHVIWRAP